MDLITDSGQASWSERILGWYEQGYSDSEVAAELKLPIKDYHKQINENEPFARLIEFGRTLSLAFWEGLARKNVGNKNFNTPIWVFYMKNKHNWGEKTDLNIDQTANLSLDQLKQRIAEEAAKFTDMYTPEKTEAKTVLRSIKVENDAL